MTDLPHQNRQTREDELLVIGCQLGDERAFDELLDRWAGPIWKYARRLTPSDDAADEVVQDVWLKVVRGIHRVRDGTRLRAWLFGIARRTLMDRLRTQYAAPPLEAIDDVDVPAGEAASDVEADLAVVEQELAKLPLVEREVLTLFYMRELSLEEVGELLEVPLGTVKSRLFRARRLLRREVERSGLGRAR